MVRLSLLRSSVFHFLRSICFQSHTTVGGTRLLFQEQSDSYQHEATVKAVEEIHPDTTEANETPERTHALYLDETIFHVRGGGQDFDLGQISSAAGQASPGTFDVKSVRYGEDDRIPHVGNFTSGDSPTLKPGDRVRLAIDVNRRNLNSRLHSAGHVLGCAIMQLSREGKLPELTETKASHYPDSAGVEFRGLIEGKCKEMIQQRADELVKKALPLTIAFWDRQECETNGIRHLPDKVGGEDEQKKFRVVIIQDAEAYPCGGTHVADSSAVGKIVVKRISRQKGTSKVSYTVS